MTQEPRLGRGDAYRTANLQLGQDRRVGGDSGDETERNFRYQHQYGVVLLAGVRRVTLDYVSLYFEHH